MFKNRWILLALGWLLVALSSTLQANAQPAGRGQGPVFLGTHYDRQDLGPFTPSGAIYFMNGTSDATVKVTATGQTMTFHFADQSTSIAASAPFLYDAQVVQKGVFLPVPQPLRPVAFFPRDAPPRYLQVTNIQLLQVVSMNVQDNSTGARLLIGLPYAEKYPEIFFKTGLLPEGVRDAASYGVVQSLVDVSRLKPDQRAKAGYPSRSFFGVYHILETPMGTFFNKKATQMELQPDSAGKLALTLPPIPFQYELINGPIPLYDIKNPDGQAVAEIVLAHHRSSAAASFSPESWPFRPTEPARGAKPPGGGT